MGVVIAAVADERDLRVTTVTLPAHNVEEFSGTLRLVRGAARRGASPADARRVAAAGMPA
jgi:hypothetical protein